MICTGLLLLQHIETAQACTFARHTAWLTCAEHSVTQVHSALDREGVAPYSLAMQYADTCMKSIVCLHKALFFSIYAEAESCATISQSIMIALYSRLPSPYELQDLNLHPLTSAVRGVKGKTILHTMLMRRPIADGLINYLHYRNNARKHLTSG